MKINVVVSCQLHEEIKFFLLMKKNVVGNLAS